MNTLVEGQGASAVISEATPSLSSLPGNSMSKAWSNPVDERKSVSRSTTLVTHKKRHDRAQRRATIDALLSVISTKIGTPLAREFLRPLKRQGRKKEVHA